jgi:hypothetical protein
VLALPPAPVVAVAAGGGGTVAVASADGARVRVVVRAGGKERSRTVRSRVGPVSDLFAATDERGATTIVWDAPSLGGRLRVRAMTVDRRDRVLAPASDVPLRPAMQPVALVAGRGRALLVANVPDILQNGSWCTYRDIGFAGDNYFGAVKGARGGFAAPTAIGTGDSYAGSAFSRDGRALSADRSGDVAGWPLAASGCTRWRPVRLAGRARMRQAVAFAGAADGSLAWIGQRNAGYFTPTGDEDTPPPQPAPGLLTAVAIGRGRAHAAGFGTGASPAVAALPHGSAAFAWLDEPAPPAFGGRGRRLPGRLWAAALGHSPTLLPGMLDTPEQAAAPQIAAGTDGVVAVLEAAGRYRLATLSHDGTREPTRDLGPVVPQNRAWLLSAGRVVYLARATSRRTTVARLR